MIEELFNDDFIEYIQLLNTHQVEYLLVGGMAVNIYGYPRSTGDMDIWVNATKTNHERLIKVHVDFRMPLGEMGELSNFLDTTNYDVFRFGGGYSHIDIMTVCKGLFFDVAVKRAEGITIKGTTFNCVAFDDLLIAKKASGRYKDLDDIENLGEK